MAEETNMPDYPRGITFEQVWAGFMEDRKRQEEFSKRQEEFSKQQEETDRQIAKTGRQIAKTDRQIAKTDRQIAKTGRQQAETDRQMKKTDRRLDRIDKIIGDLTNRFGEIAEHLVVPGIAKRFNELGYHFGQVLPGGSRILGEDGKIKTEIDIILENDESVIAVEVKIKPKVSDVEHHIRRLEIFREYRNKRHRDERKIMGAIAGAIFGKQEKTAVIEAGMYVIEQSGDTMKIDMPEGFIPREW